MRSNRNETNLMKGRRDFVAAGAASHVDDLKAARKAGLKTALVTRPLEFGLQRKADTAQDGAGIADVIATDFMDLAAQLGM